MRSAPTPLLLWERTMTCLSACPPRHRRPQFSAKSSANTLEITCRAEAVATCRCGEVPLLPADHGMGDMSAMRRSSAAVVRLPTTPPARLLSAVVNLGTCVSDLYLGVSWILTVCIQICGQHRPGVGYGDVPASKSQFVIFFSAGYRLNQEDAL